MDAKKEFLELKRAWIDAKGNDVLRAEIEGKIDKLILSLDENQRADVLGAAQDELHSQIKQAEELSHLLDVRTQMKEILPIVSVSYIAKTYFNRSASWFYQRLNGNFVHGKQVVFTSNEIDTLNYAFEDIAKKLGTFRVSC